MPGTEVTVRIAVPEDASRLRQLRLEALSLHPEAFAADYEQTAAEGADIWVERIKEYTQEHTSAIFIGEIQSNLVGMAGIGRGHWPKTRHFGILWGVYVRQEWRGNTLGEQLVRSCLEWAGQNGISIVKLGVITSNKAAIQCYQRCGFRGYGVEPKSLFYEGVYHDELLMAVTI